MFKQNKPTYKKKKKEKKEQNLDKECSQKICASDHEVKEEETKKDIWNFEHIIIKTIKSLVGSLVLSYVMLNNIS